MLNRWNVWLVSRKLEGNETTKGERYGEGREMRDRRKESIEHSVLKLAE